MDSPDELASEETCDAMGEVANMIMGSVKSRVANSLGDLQVSIPSVVSGRKLENTRTSDLREDQNRTGAPGGAKSAVQRKPATAPELRRRAVRIRCFMHRIRLSEAMTEGGCIQCQHLR
jgi:hypothetical protein